MTTDGSDERLIALETSIAHLQHQVEQMHDVILAQQEDIAALRRDLQRAHGRIDLLDDGADSGDVLDERPPHY